MIIYLLHLKLLLPFKISENTMSYYDVHLQKMYIYICWLSNAEKQSQGEALL